MWIPKPALRLESITIGENVLMMVQVIGVGRHASARWQCVLTILEGRMTGNAWRALHDAISQTQSYGSQYRQDTNGSQKCKYPPSSMHADKNGSCDSCPHVGMFLGSGIALCSSSRKRLQMAGFAMM